VRSKLASVSSGVATSSFPVSRAVDRSAMHLR
jgi:hypothetical protein